MNKLIVPKTYIEKLKAPLIFLAGPIKSTPNWQDKAIEFIFSQEKNLIIASPRKEVESKIARYIQNGDENYFIRRRTWERHYLNIASQTGTILFWLPCEEKHNCKKVYGAMTRIELEQWMTHYKYNEKIRFCIGSDGKFPELETIRYDLQLDAPNKKIMKTLEETCKEAILIAKKDL